MPFLTEITETRRSQRTSCFYVPSVSLWFLDVTRYSDFKYSTKSDFCAVVKPRLITLL